MKFFVFFLKRHKNNLILLLIFAGIFALLCVLGNMPIRIAEYGLLLCAAFSLFLYGFSYARFLVEVKSLQRVLNDLPWGLEHLPRTEDAKEYLYQEMIRKLYRVCDEREQEMYQKEDDAKEYLTLWAHQIKTPIAALRLLLASGTEEGEEAEETTEETKERKETERTLLSQERQEVLDQVFKIEQYVEMVLNYQRLNSIAGDWILERQPLDGIVRQSIRKYARQFIRKKLSLQYGGTEITVLTDGKWLGFVIDQILSNALKYTNTGEIRIRTEGQKLYISDSGIGIQRSDLPRIFERGYTGYNGHSDKRSTGIGLYLCRQICEKLGHKITVESEIGKGTVVCISLESKELDIF